MFIFFSVIHFLTKESPSLKYISSLPWQFSQESKIKQELSNRVFKTRWYHFKKKKKKKQNDVSTDYTADSTIKLQDNC